MSRIVTVIPGAKDEGTSKISKQLLKLINVDTVSHCPLFLLEDWELTSLWLHDPTTIRSYADS